MKFRNFLILAAAGLVAVANCQEIGPLPKELSGVSDDSSTTQEPAAQDKQSTTPDPHEYNPMNNVIDPMSPLNAPFKLDTLTATPVPTDEPPMALDQPKVVKVLPDGTQLFVEESVIEEYMRKLNESKSKVTPLDPSQPWPDYAKQAAAKQQKIEDEKPKDGLINSFDTENVPKSQNIEPEDHHHKPTDDISAQKWKETVDHMLADYKSKVASGTPTANPPINPATLTPQEENYYSSTPKPKMSVLQLKRIQLAASDTCVLLDYSKCSYDQLDNCDYYRVVKCLNGARCVNNMCVCPYCFSNEDCGNYNDMSIPQFLEKSYAVKLFADQTQTYSAVRAYDDDIARCASTRQKDCSCGEVVYSLDFDDDVTDDVRQLFTIDERSGVVTFNADKKKLTADSGVNLPVDIEMFVVAGNPTPPGVSVNSSYKHTTEVEVVVTLSADEKDVFSDDVAPSVLAYKLPSTPEDLSPSATPRLNVDNMSPEDDERARQAALAKAKEAQDSQTTPVVEEGAGEGENEVDDGDKTVSPDAESSTQAPITQGDNAERQKPLVESFGGDVGAHSDHGGRRRRSTVPGEFAMILTPTLTSVRVGDVNTISINFSIPTYPPPTPLKATIVANPRYRVYSINNPRVSFSGANIGNGPLSVIPTTISDYNDQYTDSFTIDFGLVDNSGVNLLDESQNDIVVMFDVLTRNSSDLLESQPYPIDVYYEYGTISFGTVETVVTYTPADWFMNILPNVTIFPASAGAIEAGSTTAWIVNISNLTDAASTFRISAFVPVGAQSPGVLVTNIYRIATGDSFNYYVSDYGNVRAQPGQPTLQTPWIEVTNKDFWLDINPGVSDYVTYLVLVSIDPTINTAQQYSIGFQVDTWNYNYTYSTFFTFPVATTTTLVADPQPSFSAVLAGGKNQMQIGSAISVQFAITPSNAYSDSYEIELDVPTTASFAFIGTSFQAVTNSFEPFVITSTAASNGGTTVTVSPSQQVDKIVITTQRTGTPATISRASFLYASFSLLGIGSLADNSSVSIMVSARYNSETSQWTENPLNVYLWRCMPDPSPNGLLIQTQPALDDSYIYPWGGQAFYVSIAVPDGETASNVIIQAMSPLDPVSGAPLFLFQSVALFDQDPQMTAFVASTVLNATTGVATITLSTIYGQNGGAGGRVRVMFTIGTPYNYLLLTDQTPYTLPVTVQQNLIYCGQTGTNTSYGGFTVFFSMQRPVQAMLPFWAPRVIWTPLTSTTVMKGGTVTYDVNVVLPPRYNAWTEIDVDIPDFELPFVGVCHIAPKAVNNNPMYPIAYTRNNGSFVLGYKGNYVWGHTTVFDPTNPVVFNLGQISVRLLNNSALVQGSTHEFAVGLTMTPWRYAFENPTITANTVKYQFSAISASFTKKNAEQTVTQSVGAIYQLMVATPVNSAGKYQFDFTVTTGASICSVVIINSGKNVPCMNNSAYAVTTITPDSGLTNNSWTVIVDSIANTQRLDAVDPSNDNNVFVEVGICVPSAMQIGVAEALAVNTNLTISGMVTVDDTFLFHNTISNKIVPAQLQTEVPPQVNMTVMGWANNVNYIHRSLRTLMNISVTTTPNSAGLFTLNVSFPVEALNTEAYGIVENIKVIAYGKNIICASMISYTSSSSLGTAQTDSGQLVFGIVNSGSWTEMPDYYDYLQAWDDNQVTIELQLRHSDHFWNVQNVARPFTMTLTYNNTNNIITVVGSMPPLAVLGTEAPDFTASWTATPVPSTSNRDTFFYVYGTVSHTQNSSAHGYLTRLQFFVPPYISVGSLISASGTLYAPYLSNSSGNSIDVVWPVILMEETASFNFSMQIDPTHTVGAMVGLVRVEIVSALKSKKLVKVLMDDQYKISGTPIPITPQEMTMDTYGLDSSRAQFAFQPPACNLPLGLSDGTILDCMIYASSYLTSFQGNTLNPGNAMPGRFGNANQAWIPYPRGNPFFSNEYLMIGLGVPSTISELHLQGDANNATVYVTTLQVQYSIDGTRWVTYAEPNGNTLLYLNWTLPHAVNDFVVYNFNPPIQGAGFVRLIPKQAAPSTTYPFMAMRVELHGCTPPHAPPTLDQCLNGTLVTPVPPNAPTTGANAYAIRSYMWIDGLNLLFACSQPSVDDYATCSRYDWKNSDWRDVPVSVVTSYDSMSGTVTALTPQGNTAVSHDNGFSWVASDDGSMSDIQTLTPSTVTSNVKIPYSDAMCTSTGDSNFATSGFTATALAPLFLSVRQTGIVYGASSNTGVLTSDLYLWGSGANWSCQ